MSWKLVKARRTSMEAKIAIQSGEDAGVVAADIQDSVAPQVQIAVEGLSKYIIGGYQGVERPGAKGDGGEEIEVYTTIFSH